MQHLLCFSASNPSGLNMFVHSPARTAHATSMYVEALILRMRRRFVSSGSLAKEGFSRSVSYSCSAHQSTKPHSTMWIHPQKYQGLGRMSLLLYLRVRFWIVSQRVSIQRKTTAITFFPRARVPTPRLTAQ